jgi:hypothetical protein
MDRLARFTDVTITNPATFGGGSARGHVRTRVSTVAYGYLGVVEEYEIPDHNTIWCLLTVSLPGLVPNLAVDHRSAFGLPGVPAGEVFWRTGDGDFDATYAVVADDESVIRNVLTPALCQLLVTNPVQRLVLSGSALILRTFDDAPASEPVVEWLSSVVEGILTSTPSFVTPRSGRDVGLRGRPLAPGLHAPAEPVESEPAKPERTRLVDRLGTRPRHRE